MTIKIIFAGTPDFAVPSLQALLNANYEICAVYTQPDRPKGRGQKLTKSPIKIVAEKYALPVEQPQTFKDPAAFAKLTAYGPDLIVVAAYGMILPKRVLDLPQLGCINVHASLLPRWRGAAPIHYAILNGDPETGITIMQMVEALDAGAMLMQRAIAITATDNSQMLHDRLAQLGGELLIETLQQLNFIKPIPQQEFLVTYAPKINKQDAKINWQESATIIAQKVRAYYGWPVAFCEYQGAVLRIWEAAVTKTHGIPGQAKLIGKNALEICCGEGALQLLKVQIAGKRVMEISEWLHGLGSVVADFS